MASSKAKTVAAYLAELAPERRKVIATVRKVVRANLPPGYAETMNWGMISYEVPLKRYPNTYNNQPLMYCALAAQKNNYAFYATTVNRSASFAKWFRGEFERSGRKLDMGKSCIRFKRLEDLPLDAIGALVARTSVEGHIAHYESVKKPR